jgi:hypothetical protein
MTERTAPLDSRKNDECGGIYGVRISQKTSPNEQAKSHH